MRLSCLLSLGFVAACTPDYTHSKTQNGALDGDEEENIEQYDGATIHIVSPIDGAFLPLGEPTSFEAELTDANGDPLDYAEIMWTTSATDEWTAEGASAEMDDVPEGQHTFYATAILPNGDQVTDAVGGVLVQHEDAGVYAGNMILDATGDYEGTPITASCIGAAIITVDALGETATGTSTCLLSLLGFSQEATHVFALELEGGDLFGSASVDLGFVAVDFEAVGEVSDGEMQAAWSDSLLGYVELDGTLEVERITRNLTGQ
jgi:hypothetical protein